MVGEKRGREVQDFPFDISKDLGEVVNWDEECPGVYYVQVVSLDEEQDTEFYLVDRQSKIISETARAYGVHLENCDSVIAFSCNAPHGGKKVLEYEMLRYCAENDLKNNSRDTMLSTAVFGKMDYPEYFGDFSAPNVTPRGFTTRYKALISGVFAIETDRCEKMIAVCFPIWDSAFTDYTLRYAEQNELDKAQGIENTHGYLFFPENSMSLALFELVQDYKEMRSSKMIDVPALCNAVWQQYPQYAAVFNREEQEGLHDIFGTIFASLGFPVELNGSVDRIIPLTLDAGTDFLHF